MSKRYRTMAALAAALVVAGCGGGGSVGVGTPPPIIDMTAVLGTGTAADPYIMPNVIPDGTDGGIEDWFAASPGHWTLSLAGGASANKAADTSGIAQIVYDTAADEWSVEVQKNAGTTWFTLAYDGTTNFWESTGWYVKDDVAGEETYLRMFDDNSSTSQYGTFGIWRGRYTSFGNSINSFRVFHTGLRTANMPTTGTGTYNGQYEVVRTSGTEGLDVYMFTGGTMTFEADFVGGTYTMTSTTAASNSVLGDTVAVSGSGAFTGNLFAMGTSEATYVQAGGNTYDLTGGFNGGFYGPSAEEVAGGFNLGVNTALGSDISLIGGYWGTQ